MNYAGWRRRFERLVERPARDIPLAEAALLIATDEYVELDIDRYLRRIASMAEQVRPHLPSDRNPQASIKVLNTYLFKELGFRGNTENYYDPRNSYLNDVLDRKLGLPITLAAVHIAVARQLGLPVDGVGLPGHFIVKWQDEETQVLVDPFHGGRVLTLHDVEELVRDTYHAQAHLEPEWLEAVDTRYILIRLLNNLKVTFIHGQDYLRAWKVVDKLLILNPRAPENIRDMGLLSVHVGAYRRAASCLEEYLLAHADAADAEQLRVYLRSALQAVERLN